jgi:N-acetylglucosaminyldiphosphoundecaprenol N-acetyl-beta-D-mannosaminyltransferase
MKEIQKQNRVRVVSLFPDVVSHNATIEKVAELVNAGDGGYVCFSTVHMTMEAHDDPEFAKIVNGADLIVTDGMPIVWMQKLQGKKDANRVRANDMMIALCAYAAEKNLSVGFYGGKPEVIDKIRERAGRDHPDLKIAYAFSPPFRPLAEAEDAEITAEINRAAPDILFMGLGCPKQENWMAAHQEKLKAVMLGVGASFDFYAGNVKESPAWLGKLGLEWLFRFMQEPKRLWRRYLILNPRFVWLAAIQLLKGRNPRVSKGA